MKLIHKLIPGYLVISTFVGIHNLHRPSIVTKVPWEI